MFNTQHSIFNVHGGYGDWVAELEHAARILGIETRVFLLTSGLHLCKKLVC